MDEKALYALLGAQQKIVSLIALGSPLGDCLKEICLLIEGIIDIPGARASVLLLEGDSLHHGAGPSLPPAYCEAINGVQIGDKVGSCGTAAYLKKQVIVTDIENDPLWADYKAAALPHELRACWSTPLFSSAGDVLGTFAVYYAEPRTPEQRHLEVIELFTQLTSLAIEKTLASQREQRLTAQLASSNDKFSAFTSVMPDLAIIISEEGEYVDVYGAYESLMYTGSKDMIGKTMWEILPEAEADSFMRIIQKALKTDGVQVFQYDLPVPKGLLTFEGRVAAIDNYLLDKPEKRYVLWMARDITERRNAERKIEELAYFDPLTGLPNRRMLKDRLQLMIDKTHRDHLNGALLYLDLDDFKRINDSLGHSVGDELLLKVTERLKPILRATDIFARIGGDEFIVLLESLEKDLDQLCEDASHAAEKIIRAFDEKFSIQSGSFNVGVSVGVSVIKGKDITSDEALKRADAAMYRSKKLGGGRYSFFDPALQKSLDLRLELEKDIIRGIEERQLCAHFQPQIDIQGNLIGAEALIRWMHPEKGFIPPLDFIYVAEQQGLMEQLQEVVLKDACRLLNQLIDQSIVDDAFCIAINISAAQFKHASLKQELMDILHAEGVKPEQIKLEITESMLIDNIETTIAQMNELKEQGFAFSIDDFGTGYSSLTYLHTFPIDELKIDKSFIDKLHLTDVGSGIVDAIISLSRHIGFEVVAEGVEEEIQKTMLIERDIKAMQGYHFSKPLPPEAFIDWVRARHS